MQDDQGWLDHSLIQCYLSSVVEEGDKQWKKSPDRMCTVHGKVQGSFITRM
jgi:hypothetical protein